MNYFDDVPAPNKPAAQEDNQQQPPPSPHGAAPSTPSKPTSALASSSAEPLTSPSADNIEAPARSPSPLSGGSKTPSKKYVQLNCRPTPIVQLHGGFNSKQICAFFNF